MLPDTPYESGCLSEGSGHFRSQDPKEACALAMLVLYYAYRIFDLDSFALALFPKLATGPIPEDEVR